MWRVKVESNKIKRQTESDPRPGGRQPVPMVGASGSDAMHRLALAKEGLAQNRQHRQTAISHPGSD